MKFLQKRNDDDDVVEVKKERAPKKEKRDKQTEEEKELRKEKKLIKKRVSYLKSSHFLYLSFIFCIRIAMSPQLSKNVARRKTEQSEFLITTAKMMSVQVRGVM